MTTMEWLPEHTIGLMIQKLKHHHTGYSMDYIHCYNMKKISKLNEYFRYIHLCSIPIEQFTPKDHSIYQLGKTTRPLWTHLYNNSFITQCIVTLQKHLKDRYITYVILHDVIENEFKHAPMNAETMANLAMLEMLKFILGKPRI